MLSIVPLKLTAASPSPYMDRGSIANSPMISRILTMLTNTSQDSLLVRLNSGCKSSQRRQRSHILIHNIINIPISLKLIQSLSIKIQIPMTQTIHLFWPSSQSMNISFYLLWILSRKILLQSSHPSAFSVQLSVKAIIIIHLKNANFVRAMIFVTILPLIHFLSAIKFLTNNKRFFPWSLKTNKIKLFRLWSHLLPTPPRKRIFRQG